MPRILANGVNLYYEVRGSGRPLVLINGLTTNIDWWEPEFVDRLAERYRLLLFDNRGAGRSDVPKGEYTIPLFAEDTVALMRETGFEQAHVFGLSMGGMIAQELAINHPEMVDRLVLCSTFCGGENAVHASREVINILMDTSGSQEDIARRILRVLFTDEWLNENPEAIDCFVERTLKYPMPFNVAARQFMATAKFDAYDRLSRISSPTLVIAGTEDILIPPENSKVLDREIPNTRLVELEGVGHAVTSQVPEEVADLFMAFLDEPGH